MENKKVLSFTEEVVQNLKLEARSLGEKLKNCREKDDFSMYKNLIKAYGEVIQMIQRYDWQLRYSEYESRSDENEEFKKQVAVWQQNSEGLIKNHKIWNIQEEIKV